MTYLQGFLVPAKTAMKQEYRDMAAKAAPVFANYGALRTVECWGEDVPDGKRTDMKRAVKAEADETVVFSWIIWPDKATCDAAAEKMMADERMKPGDGPMPFDMQRLIYAGFDVVADTGEGGMFRLVDGIVAPAPGDSREAFADYAAKLARFFRKHGALRLVDGWGANVPDGKVTDFKRAVAAEAGEQVIFGWIEWPDKTTREAAFAAVGEDEELNAAPPPIDMARAIFGGFVPIFDTDQA